MNKIILIEDRINRQKNMLGNLFEKLNDFPDLSNKSGGTDFEEIKQQLNYEKFGDIFNDFKIIMVHRSALETSVRNKLIDFCIENGKTLVLFSGGVSNATIEKKKNNSFIVLLNAQTFYSHNLIDFLNNKEHNPYILAFGKNWEINLLYEALEVFKRILLKEPEIKKPFGAFETEIPSTFVKEKYFKDFLNQNFIDKLILEKICNTLIHDINQII